MGKRNRRNKRKTSSNHQKNKQPAPSPDTPSGAETKNKPASSAKTREDTKTPTNNAGEATSPSAAINAAADEREPLVKEREQLDEDREKLKQLKEELEEGQTKLNEDQEKQKAEEERLSKERTRLGNWQSELQDLKTKQETLELTLEERESELDVREANIRKRELNAENEFAKEKLKMLEEFKGQRDELKETIEQLKSKADEQRAAQKAEAAQQKTDLEEQLEQRRSEFEEELRLKREEHDSSLQEREEELRLKREEQKAQQRELDQTKRELEDEQEDLQDLRKHLQERAEQIAARRVEALEYELAAVHDRLDQARADRDRHEQTLQERAEADRRFGQRTPEELLQEMEDVHDERDRLREELRQRLSGDDQARLESLIEAERQWTQERQELVRSSAELQRRLEYASAQNLELETQRDVITSLESQRELLSEANRQVRAEIDDLIARNEAESAFPACSKMDEDQILQSPVPMHQDSLRLDRFVEDLQHRIAGAYGDRTLFYTKEDLRAFVGGLAMGHLLLLQGISGTGKTSLPLAFARAVGGSASVIEVQAGWRDPQDLVGHYNNFEKRFHEQEFLQALYKAQTPRWKEGIHIVLLDEMNLSHPEQYFSDMLSTLERAPSERSLTVMAHAVRHPPRLFNEGRKLRIPQNVWFIGTANHDETTKNFADKTYDRSHVQEFPHRPERFDVKPVIERHPIPFSLLHKAFEDAFKRHEDIASEAISALNKELREPLTQNFGIGWGPRLERQIGRYVPVVRSAGGATGEALDHILATRLIRKLRHRHDNRPEHLQDLRETVRLVWDRFDATPTKSLNMIDQELRRLGVEV